MSERRIVWILLKRNIRFWVCLALVLFVVVLAVVGPHLTTYGPMEVVEKVYTVDETEANRTKEEIIQKYGIEPKDVFIDRVSITTMVSIDEANATIAKLREEGYVVGDIMKIGDKVIITYIVPGKVRVRAVIRSQPPSPEFPFGTDRLGYDVFASTVYGLRVSLSIGVIAAIVATLVGTVLGLLAGYVGGWVDTVVDGVTNLLLAIPTVFLMMVIGLFYIMGATDRPVVGRELINILFLGLVVGLLSWHWTARAVKAQVAALKVSDFIAVSRLSGNTSIKIIAKDILPNIASYILLVFVIQLANALGTVVTLEFLGIKAAEWSLFAKINHYLMMGELWGAGWHTLFIPGIIIVVMIASLYIIVLSLEEVFNPRLRRA